MSDKFYQVVAIETHIVTVTYLVEASSEHAARKKISESAEDYYIVDSDTASTDIDYIDSIKEMPPLADEEEDDA